MSKGVKNVKNMNLLDVRYLSLAQIVNILKSYKINHVSFRGNDFKSRQSDFTISSSNGYVILYDGENQFLVKFKNIQIHPNRTTYLGHDEYVAFDYDIVSSEIEVENYKESDILLIEHTQKPAIFLHKKYIHMLSVFNGLEGNIDIEPTRCLKLFISDLYTEKYEGLVEYLNSHSLERIFTEVKFSN